MRPSSDGPIWPFLRSLFRPPVSLFLLVGGGLFWLLMARTSLSPLLSRRRRDSPGPERHRGRTWSLVVGNGLLAVGLASLLLAGIAYVSDLSAGERALPRSAALTEGGSGESAPTSTSGGEASGSLQSTEADRAPSLATATATVAPTETAVPTVTPTPVRAGAPVRVVIPSIEVDSEVREAGTYWENGQLQWQTLPWVVAHYETTAKAGERGNAVFSGHVTSRNAGNVFADLYKMQLGDEVRVYSEENEFIYVVSSIREVLPTEVSVMDPTPDATATLITCAGVWIPSERSYSRRLIVSAKLKSGRKRSQ